MKGSQLECSRRETVRVDFLCSEVLGRFGSAIDESGNRHSEEWTETVRNLPPHSNSVVPPSSANKIGGLRLIPGLLSAPVSPLHLKWTGSVVFKHFFFFKAIEL